MYNINRSRIFIVFGFVLTVAIIYIYNNKSKIITSINLIPRIETSPKENLNNTDTFLKIWKEIFEVSEEQKLIKPEIIIKTAKFMIEERKEDDPELIEFVKSFIEPPSKKPRTLSVKGKSDFSQYNQSCIIDNILKLQKNGFFIEAGALNGELFSNTLYLEIERNWTGLLIEPVPSFYQQVRSKNRNAYTINACIANNHPSVAKFKVNAGLSGRNKELSQVQDKILGPVYHFIYVPCFPLYTILKAINQLKIDYFSVDLEGGEYDVISHIDFSKINIRFFSIEWAPEEYRKKLFIDFLAKFGYRLAEMGLIDLFMIKD